MEDVAGLQPDIVCLPELFDTHGRRTKTLSELAEEEDSGPGDKPDCAYAKKITAMLSAAVHKERREFYNSTC